MSTRRSRCSTRAGERREMERERVRRESETHRRRVGAPLVRQARANAEPRLAVLHDALERAEHADVLALRTAHLPCQPSPIDFLPSTQRRQRERTHLARLVSDDARLGVVERLDLEERRRALVDVLRPGLAEHEPAREGSASQHRSRARRYKLHSPSAARHGAAREEDERRSPHRPAP